jgi:DNA (cytosine-5)-methyltransferase 1
MVIAMARNNSETLNSVGLFAGIGGIELGISQAGHRAQMICEIDPGAAEVLRQRFGMSVEPDVRKLSAFPKVDLITAGFPCQDLSQAGRTAGIVGHQSRLIGEVFRRLRWVNVGKVVRAPDGKESRILVSSTPSWRQR